MKMKYLYIVLAGVIILAVTEVFYLKNAKNKYISPQAQVDSREHLLTLKQYMEKNYNKFSKQTIMHNEVLNAAKHLNLKAGSGIIEADPDYRWTFIVDCKKIHGVYFGENYKIVANIIFDNGTWQIKNMYIPSKRVTVKSVQLKQK